MELLMENPIINAEEKLNLTIEQTYFCFRVTPMQ